MLMNPRRVRVNHNQTVGMPTVAVSTVVMAGSLVQVPMVAATSSEEQKAYSRYKIFMGALHVGCRLIVVRATDPESYIRDV